MAYLNFNKIVPPAPNDPNVNEVTQLNDNWDELDNKLAPYIVGGTIFNVEDGQEFFNSDFDFCVYDTASGVGPDDISEGWSAWTTLPMATGRFPRPSFTPKWRNNPTYRMVELSGGVLFDAAAGPWPLGSNFLINADTSGSPPGSMQPIGNLHHSPAASGLTSGGSVVAAGFITVEQPLGHSFTRIRAQYLGGPGGGNFIMLDQVWWWY